MERWREGGREGEGERQQRLDRRVGGDAMSSQAEPDDGRASDGERKGQCQKIMGGKGVNTIAALATYKYARLSSRGNALVTTRALN